MYDLSPVLDLAPLSSLEPGSALLVSDQTRTGQAEVVTAVLADGLRHEEGAVGVSTDDDGTDWIADLEPASDGLPGTGLSVIDCGANRERTERHPPNDAFRYSVPDPTDLTGIGIGVTKCFDRLQETGTFRARLGLASLSAVLEETNRKTTFKFCHVLTSRLNSAGFLGLFTIDATGHDEQTRQVIRQAFDAEVELRGDDGGREARVRGLGDSETGWQPL